MEPRVEPSVLWREGMFLCPQHLQAFGREIQARQRHTEGLGLPGRFGLWSLAIDDDDLARDVFAVKEATLLLPDGTLLAIPRNAHVEPREFAPLFLEPELDVFLGIAAAQPNVPQVSFEGGADGARVRYRARVEPIFDENLRDAPKDLEFRDIAARLFFGSEDRTGFTCAHVARIARRGRPVARSVQSATHVPPILRIGASPALVQGLREASNALRAQARDLAARIPATAGLSSVQKGADLAGFVKLAALNQCLGFIEPLAFQGELHPYHAWERIVQAIGALAVFGDERVVPDLPTYDHADLERTFGAALRALKILIGTEVAVPYDAVPFRKDPDHEGFYSCEIPPEWIARQPIFYLAVEAARKADAVMTEVETGIKLVAPGDVERVLGGVVPGIDLVYERVPPLAFPKRSDLHFFRVSAEGASRESWLAALDARAAVILSALGGLGDVGFSFYVELRSR